MIVFARPWYLLLLVLLVPMIWVYFRTYTALSPARRKVSGAVRLSILLMVIAAAAGIQWRSSTDDRYTVFLLDQSASIGNSARAQMRELVNETASGLRPDDKMALVGFAEKPIVMTEGERDVAFGEGYDLDGNRTNIEDAVRVGRSLVPDGFVGRIVLVSDGRENGGKGLGAIESAASSGVDVDYVRLAPSAGTDASIEQADLPAQARRGQPFSAHLVIASDSGQRMEIQVERSGRELARFAYDHPGGGARRLAIPVEAGEQGIEQYRFRLIAPLDDYDGNNIHDGFVKVQGPSTILAVGRDRAEYEAMIASAPAEGYEIERRLPGDFPLSAVDMRDYDAVVLANVPATALSERTMEVANRFVREGGGGLLMSGGPESFGAGGYYRTPVEEVLPVTMDLRNRRELPVSAIALAIDKSGSMSSMMGGYNKLDLAKRAAILTAELMNEHDYIGVAAFDGAAKTVVPFRKMESVARVVDAIGSLRAGGGTNMFPAMELAREWLTQIPEMNKHLIVLSDGATAGENYQSLAASMLSEGITISTVSIGPGSNLPLMDQIAQSGGGRSYTSNDASDIPRIFTREAMLTVKKATKEETFRAEKVMNHEMIEGISVATMPPLHGYVMTSLKSRSDLALAAMEGDPLLASTRSGLGKTAAWTSDFTSRWAIDWIRSEEALTLVEQIVRWVLPDASGDLAQYILDSEGDQVSVSLDLPEFLDGSRDVRARAVGPDGEIVERRLERAGARRYTGKFDLPRRGRYLLTFSDESGEAPILLARTAVGYSYSPEFRSAEDEVNLFDRISGVPGVTRVSGPSEILRPSGREASRLKEMGRELLFIAALLFLFDVAIRRVQFRLADLKAIWKPAESRPAPDSVDRLTMTLRRERADRRDKRVKPPVIQSTVTTARSENEDPPGRPGTSVGPEFGAPSPSSSRDTPAGKVPPDEPAPPGTTQRLLDSKRRFRDKYRD